MGYQIKFIVCPICKKKFIPASEHAWKIGGETENRLVCSYHCMRQWECVHLKPKKKKKGR